MDDAEDTNEDLDKLYLVIVWGDVEPNIEGPFTTPEERDAFAGKYRFEEGDEHGIYKLYIRPDGSPHIYPYSGGEMDELVDAAEAKSNQIP